MAAGETPPQAAYRLPAHLGEHRVMLIDYSAQGVLLEHYRLVPEGEEAIWCSSGKGSGSREVPRRPFRKVPRRVGQQPESLSLEARLPELDPETASPIDRIVRERHRI